MRLPLIALAALALVPLETACDFEDIVDASGHFHEDFQYSYDLKPGGRLSVESFNGSIEILGWEKDSVQVTGTKSASREELLKQIQIEAKTGDNAVSIRAVRPRERHGNMGAKFVIRVPHQVVLDRIISSNGAIRVEDIKGNAHLETSNGGIRLRQFEGRLDARTSNGAIEADSIDGGAVVHTSNGGIRLDRVAGSVEASTSNGGVHVRMAKPSPNDRLTFESSNGSVEVELASIDNNEIRASTSNAAITLRMPAAIKARLRASTSNSSITSDFDVSTHGTITKNRLEGEINGGGPLLDLNTSNGSIKLQKL
jgi:DUF4097 and DUF4098 domain-containing protein YvlB